MEIALYVGPFLIALLSFGLLFLSTQQLGVGILILFISLGIAGTMAYQTSAIFEQQAKLNLHISVLNQWKERQIARLHGILAQLRPQVEESAFNMNHFASLGWDIRNEALIRSLIADKARQQVIDELPKKHFISKPVLIKNLPEDIDQLVVAQSLEELGFSVDLPAPPESALESVESNPNSHNTKEEENQSSEKEGKKDKKGEKEEEEEKQKKAEKSKKKQNDKEEPEIRRANVMYYGPYVKAYEIKLAALTMIRAGVNLKLIRLSKQVSGDKARAIIFDWSKTYGTRPNLDPMDVYSKKSFRRN